jgi:uncharacterized protein
MLIGRIEEKKILTKAYQSPEAQFIVLYGRRRVGKTYLVRSFFQNVNCTFFDATGQQRASLKTQLTNFTRALSDTFTQAVMLKELSTWREAFEALTQLINTTKPAKKVVIFLDELPWMATRKSGLLEILDYYWNHYWSKNKNVILVVCGSSASWLIKNIIYNKGGLHNRCTSEIRLDPFSLAETYDYLSFKKVTLTKKHTLQLYMALGGIPYYLNNVEPGLSATENIQRILFNKKAPLREEFHKLFSSLFKNAEAYIELLRLIAKKKEGISRVALEAAAKLTPGGGRLTTRLKHLMQTNFIESYIPWGKQRGEYYQVIDEFCLFYLYWLEPKQNMSITSDHWLKQTKKPIYHVWAGYAFEAVCLKHIEQIIKALNITTAETISSWRLASSSKCTMGAQIDLVIDRSDDTITLCEIKYTDKPFVINKAYAASLKNKIDVFKNATKTQKQIFLSLVSANGIKENQYFNKLISSTAELDALFKNLEQR